MYCGTVSSGIIRRVSRHEIKLVNFYPGMDEDNDDGSYDDRKECFCDEGLSAYISWLNVNKKRLHDTIGFRKEVKGVTMEFWLQWCVDGFSDTMLGYANDNPTVDGGTHIDGVKDGIIRTLNRLTKKDEDITFSWEHVRKGLTCIISVLVPNPEFEGHTQTRLGNPYVREIVGQSVEEYLTEYFELHPDVLERITSRFLIAYKSDLVAKRARESVLLRSVSTPCTVPEKLTNGSSDTIEIIIGGGDSSGGAGKHVPNQRLQNKRTREQPRRNRTVSTAPGQYLESNLEKKRRVLENCVPSSHARFSSRRTVGSSNPPNDKDVSKETPKDVTNRRDVCKKTVEDVTNESEKAKAFIPIGPGFQAEIPVWIAPTKRGKFYGSPGDSDTLRWLGTGVWPTYSLKKKAVYKKVGEGRSDSCSCASPRSTDCVKQHIKEARELLEKELGREFYSMKFDEMGEVKSRTWTPQEEQKFEALVKRHPLSTSNGFWKFALKHFPRKSEKDLISYYQNVFLLKRTRSLADSSADHIDSDDDNCIDFLAG